MPYQVRERLFIGDITAAAAVLQHGSAEFTHVLSLLSSPYISFFSEWRPDVVIPTEEIRSVYTADAAGSKLLYLLERAGPGLRIVRMAAPLRDIEDDALLYYLEPCLDFIDEARKQGSVLVHCFAGVSRSASVIVAYLMRTERKSVNEALESLRESNDMVNPNDGFMDQLGLFEAMGFKVDTSSPIYKRFRLKVLGLSYNQGAKVDMSVFGADPGVAPAPYYSEEASKKQQKNAYCCKKCRRIVALEENVVSHTPGEKETARFGYYDESKKKGGSSFCMSEESECSSLFVEPLKWMTSVEEGAIQGKLSCINCGARLGHFNWSGIQCSCGSWTTPAFQIQKSKVDIRIV